MTARIVIRLATICALVLVPLLCLADDANKNVVLSNSFLRVVVNGGQTETGRFSIDTTGGDPTRESSKNQQLIYGGNIPWTSYTTVRIDDHNYVFGGKTEKRPGKGADYGVWVSGPTLKDNGIFTTYQYDDVQVTQELRIARGVESRYLDTIGITYRISNMGKANHQVGIRMLLDTKLGPNDGAPICAGGGAPTSTPTILQGDDIKDKWQSFDNFGNPTIISLGTLYGANTNANRPDKVIFADWGTLADDSWDVSLDAKQGFHRKWEGEQEVDYTDLDELDTAAALYWNPVTIEPEKSASVTTNYGIGYLTFVPGELKVGIPKSADTTFEYERTQPFTLSGFVQNSSMITSDVSLEIKLPEGLALVPGSKAKVTIPNMKPGDVWQADWTVVATGKGGDGVKHVQYIASTPGDQIEKNDKAVTGVTVNIPKPKLVLSPDAQRLPLLRNKKPAIVPINIDLTPAVDFYGIRFTLTYDPTVMKPVAFSPVNRGSALAEDNRLLDGFTYDTSELGRIVITASRADAAKLTKADINLAVIQFKTVGVGKCEMTFSNAVLLNEKGEESPVATSAGKFEVSADPVP